MLTICLISQGRPQISEFLDSVAEIANLGYVNFVVVDNGAAKPYSQILKSWSDAHSNSIYIRREVNSTDLNQVWSDINLHLSDWVVFPGDDDRLILDGVKEWKLLAEKNTSANAIAMSARILNPDGSANGEVSEPSIAQISSSTSPLAYSLHNPPFFWPALFIKTSSIKTPFPISRYVVDWSISINLVMDEKYFTSTIPIVEYRRHHTQESNLVSFNRKVFEGIYHLDSFINSDLFVNWIKSRSEIELLSFWRSAIIHPPLYGDPELSNTLLIGLARIIRSSKYASKLQNELVSDLSLRLGALLHDESIEETLGAVNESSNNLGNLRIENEALNCPIIHDLLSSLRGFDNSLKIEISCKHNPTKAGIHIDCEQYVNFPKRHALDALVRDISLALESKGELAFRISPTERKLIILVRKFKRFTPSFLKSRFGRI
jgi:hypothetical protein